MSIPNETEIFYPATKDDWRQWLEEHHLNKQSVWVVFYRKHSGRPSLLWQEAVEVALCYGWIDSKKIKIDDETSHQFFTKRKPKSIWSKINKDKVELLMQQGLMSEAGLKSVQLAKDNGSWSSYDAVEAMVIPPYLEIALKQYANAYNNFQSFSKSTKKILLYWVLSAKREETRTKRIESIVAAAENNQKPPGF